MRHGGSAGNLGGEALHHRSRQNAIVQMCRTRDVKIWRWSASSHIMAGAGVLTIQQRHVLVLCKVQDVKMFTTLDIDHGALGGAQGRIRSGDVDLNELHGDGVGGHGKVRHDAYLCSWHAAAVATFFFLPGKWIRCRRGGESCCTTQSAKRKAR